MEHSYKVNVIFSIKLTIFGCRKKDDDRLYIQPESPSEDKLELDSEEVHLTATYEISVSMCSISFANVIIGLLKFDCL